MNNYINIYKITELQNYKRAFKEACETRATVQNTTSGCQTQIYKNNKYDSLINFDGGRTSKI
jgi:hypothetical protein